MGTTCSICDIDLAMDTLRVEYGYTCCTHINADAENARLKSVLVEIATLAADLTNPLFGAEAKEKRANRIVELARGIE